MATLKDIIKRNRKFTDPLAVAEAYYARLEEIADKKIAAAIEAAISDRTALFEKDLQSLSDSIPGIRTQVFAELKDALLEKINSMPDIKGDPGEPGKDADVEAIVKRIRSTIRTPEDGYTPIKGKDFSDGKPGKDGSPDTPDQVVSKVNKAGKKIKQDQIKDLDKAFKRLEEYIARVAKQKGGGSKGGGGMGNVQHESTIVTSATTSVPTNFRIAGGGYAIWPHYNGSALTRGKDYTVSTDQKTVNLLFTPDDPTPGQNNTVLNIYIRT